MKSIECVQCGLVSWPTSDVCRRCGAPLSREKPPVVKWFVVYCVLMALMYLALVVTGIVFLFADPSDLDMKAAEARIMSVVFIIMGLIFCAPFLFGIFLPQKSWAWIFGLVLICVGLTSACLLPICIPLLVFWIKPETKTYFGRYPRTPPPPPRPGSY